MKDPHTKHRRRARTDFAFQALAFVAAGIFLRYVIKWWGESIDWFAIGALCLAVVVLRQATQAALASNDRANDERLAESLRE